MDTPQESPLVYLLPEVRDIIHGFFSTNDWGNYRAVNKDYATYGLIKIFSFKDPNSQKFQEQYLLQLLQNDTDPMDDIILSASGHKHNFFGFFLHNLLMLKKTGKKVFLTSQQIQFLLKHLNKESILLIKAIYRLLPNDQKEKIDIYINQCVTEKISSVKTDCFDNWRNFILFKDYILDISSIIIPGSIPQSSWCINYDHNEIRSLFHNVPYDKMDLIVSKLIANLKTPSKDVLANILLLLSHCIKNTRLNPEVIIPSLLKCFSMPHPQVQLNALLVADKYAFQLYGEHLKILLNTIKNLIKSQSNQLVQQNALKIYIHHSVTFEDDELNESFLQLIKNNHYLVTPFLNKLSQSKIDIVTEVFLNYFFKRINQNKSIFDKMYFFECLLYHFNPAQLLRIETWIKNSKPHHLSYKLNILKRLIPKMRSKEQIDIIITTIHHAFHNLNSLGNDKILLLLELLEHVPQIIDSESISFYFTNLIYLYADLRADSPFEIHTMILNQIFQIFKAWEPRFDYFQKITILKTILTQIRTSDMDIIRFFIESLRTDIAKGVNVQEKELIEANITEVIDFILNHFLEVNKLVVLQIISPFLNPKQQQATLEFLANYCSYNLAVQNTVVDILSLNVYALLMDCNQNNKPQFGMIDKSIQAITNKMRNEKSFENLHFLRDFFLSSHYTPEEKWISARNFFDFKLPIQIMDIYLSILAQSYFFPHANIFPLFEKLNTHYIESLPEYVVERKMNSNATLAEHLFKHTKETLEYFLENSDQPDVLRESVKHLSMFRE